MNLFHVIDDVFVILRTKTGVYKQAKVYARGDALFAGHAGGFVKLLAGGTSCPNVSWEEFTADPRITRARVGPFSFNAHASLPSAETKAIGFAAARTAAQHLEAVE